MNKIITVILILVSGGISTLAQVPTKTFRERKAFETHPRFMNSAKISSMKKMPKFDVASMIEEDEALKGIDVPFRFGKGFDVNYSLKDGNWDKTSDGKIWSLTVQSEGAFSINFVFSELHLPKGGEMYIYNEAGSMVYGPVTSKQNLKEGLFLTDLVQGDKVIIHIYEPSDSKEATRLRIQRVVHAYRDMFDGYSLGPGTAENCHNNIDCHSNWEDESDAVALILLASGTEHCTGALLNNTANDYTPNILTAFHCIDASRNGSLSTTEITNAESWMFKFGFRTNDCGGMNYSSTTYNRANYLSSWFQTDFALLEMEESPVGNENITFLGWDNSENTPTSGAGIHHPSGDYMKISFENQQFSTSSRNGVDSNYWHVEFDDGVVEHGSSGSPLFNQQSRVVGHLWYNLEYDENKSYCEQPRADYGRFNISWDGDSTDTTQLAHWLDPNNTGDPTTDLLRSPSITVPDLICYSGTTVSMQDPPGVTITWGGENVEYPNGDTGTSVTVRALSTSTSNTGTVTASFTINGRNYTISHPVWVGKPAFTGIINGNISIPLDETEQYWVDASEIHLQELTVYDWDVTSNLDMVSSHYYQQDVYVEGVTKGRGTVYFLATNGCGSSQSSLPVMVTDMLLLSITPNPANDETTLTIESSSGEKAIDETAEWGMEIYSPTQALKATKTRLKGKSTTIQTAGWTEGIYTVRVKYKDEILTGKLIVKE